MENPENVTKRQKALNIICLILIVITLLLVLTIIVGTIWAMANRQSPAPVESSGSETVLPGRTAPSEMPDNIFTGIGRLRLTTNDAVMVIVTVNFPFPADDKPFFEELVLRTSEFRSITIKYFGDFNSSDLIKTDENTLKTGLLELFNSILNLGKIETLYFDDYLVLL